MDARAKTVRDIFRGGDQYLVPFFQRSLLVAEEAWQRFLDDVVDLLDDNSCQHFLGPVVCTPLQTVPGQVTPYHLIDAQQRLTTLCLAIAALRDVAHSHAAAGIATTHLGAAAEGCATSERGA